MQSWFGGIEIFLQLFSSWHWFNWCKLETNHTWTADANKFKIVKELLKRMEGSVGRGGGDVELWIFEIPWRWHYNVPLRSELNNWIKSLLLDCWRALAREQPILGCTVKQFKNNSKTFQWINSRNYKVSIGNHTVSSSVWN